MALGALVFSTAAARAQEQPPIVVTTGTAVVQRAPDVAFIVVAVQTRAKNPRDAQQQNAARMADVARKLSELSIPADARKTIGLRLDQEYDTAGGRRQPLGFVAHNAVEVRIDDMSRAGEVADAVVQAGATSIDGIRFDIKDRAAAEREAIRLAVANARGRAEAAAAGAGRAIDRILKIEEGEPSAPRPMAMMRMEAASATAVEPGLIDVRATVTLTVAMK